MGYTHYYRRKPELDARKFQAFAADAKKILESDQARRIGVAGFDGNGEPEITEEAVRFNGRSPDDFETCAIERKETPSEWETPDKEGRIFNCCKTGRRPYDIVVGAVLIAAKHHFGDDIIVTSDGEWEETWENASSLAHEVLGYRGYIRTEITAG